MVGAAGTMGCRFKASLNHVHIPLFFLSLLPDLSSLYMRCYLMLFIAHQGRQSPSYLSKQHPSGGELRCGHH